MAALGHQNSRGHGPLNTFGLDFMKEGRKWTQKLCALDSDQDGRSNGMELGDPDCTWVRTKTVSTTVLKFQNVQEYGVLSHPGIYQETFPKQGMTAGETYEIDPLMDEDDDDFGEDGDSEEDFNFDEE